MEYRANKYHTQPTTKQAWQHIEAHARRGGEGGDKIPSQKKAGVDSLHQVSVGAFLPSALDDGHDAADEADAERALQRLRLQLAGMLHPSRRCHWTGSVQAVPRHRIHTTRETDRDKRKRAENTRERCQVTNVGAAPVGFCSGPTVRDRRPTPPTTKKGPTGTTTIRAKLLLIRGAQTQKAKRKRSGLCRLSGCPMRDGPFRRLVLLLPLL